MTDLVAAGTLCLIECHVCPLGQCIDRLVVCFDGVADANRDWPDCLVLMQDHLLADGFTQFIQKLMDFDGAVMGINPDEFFAAKAGNKSISIICVLLHESCDCNQGSVTCQMSMGVVEILEVVDIQDGQYERPIGWIECSQEFVESTAIWQVCQRVIAALVCKRFVHPLQSLLAAESFLQLSAQSLAFLIAAVKEQQATDE